MPSSRCSPGPIKGGFSCSDSLKDPDNSPLRFEDRTKSPGALQPVLGGYIQVRWYTIPVTWIFAERSPSSFSVSTNAVESFQ